MRYLLLFAVFITTAATAQTDTTYLYFNKEWKECQKDTAYYMGKVYKQGELWERQDSWMATGVVQMKATYLTKECDKAHGTTTYYREDGTVNSITRNKDGKPLSAEFFYESGKKKGDILYNEEGIVQTGYDETGKVIPGYVVEREAMFPGGQHGWRMYLEKHLDANVVSKVAG